MNYTVLGSARGIEGKLKTSDAILFAMMLFVAYCSQGEDQFTSAWF